MSKKNSSLDVFKKLRLKFAVILLLVLAFFLFSLIGGMNIYLRKSNTREAEVFMNMIIENNGLLSSNPLKNTLIENQGQDRPKYLTESLPDSSNYKERRNLFGNGPVPGNYQNSKNPALELKNIIQEDDLSEYLRLLVNSVYHQPKGYRDFCSAKLTEDGDIIQITTDFSTEVSLEDEKQLIARVFEMRKPVGKFRSWYYRIEPKKYGYILIILNREIEQSQELRFLAGSVIFFMLSLLIVFVFTFVMSSISVRPVKDAFMRQKQFIADASHELKTPIAVIGANIDVLQQEIPDNKWLEYIKTENTRMGALVKDLLYLAKHDADRIEQQYIPFDLADAAACAVLPFESVAWEQKKKLEIDIPKDVIEVTGNEEEIKRVVIILTDNALKNSDENATIRVTAGSDGNKAFVKVYNTGHGISPEDMKKIFDRFYRADSSRARATGGYGLGLAIAKTIADSHKGKILVESVIEEYACFTLVLPKDFKETRRNLFIHKN